MAFGLDAILPLEFLIPTLRVAQEIGWTGHEFSERLDQLERLDEQRLMAVMGIYAQKRRLKAFHDKHVKTKNFKEGDAVLAYTLKEHTGKLQKRGMGPYLIHRLSNSGAVQLATLDGEPMANWISGCRIKKYNQPLTPEMLRRVHEDKERKAAERKMKEEAQVEARKNKRKFPFLAEKYTKHSRHCHVKGDSMDEYLEDEPVVMPYIDVELGLQRNIEPALIDTGATYSSMSYETWARLDGYTLEKTEMAFTAFSGEVSQAYGKCTVDMFLNGINCAYRFYVLQPGLDTIPIILGQSWQIKHDAVCEWRKKGVRCEINGRNFLVPFLEDYLKLMPSDYDQNAPLAPGAKKYTKIAKVDEPEEALRKEAEKKRMAKGKEKLEDNLDTVQPVRKLAMEQPLATTSNTKPKEEPKAEPVKQTTQKATHARRRAKQQNREVLPKQTYKWVAKSELVQQSILPKARPTRGPTHHKSQETAQRKQIWLPKKIAEAQRHMDAIWVPKHFLKTKRTQSKTKLTHKRRGPTQRPQPVKNTRSQPKCQAIWIPKALAQAQRYQDIMWVPKRALRQRQQQPQTIAKRSNNKRRQPKATKPRSTPSQRNTSDKQVWIPKALADAQRYMSTIWVPKQALGANKLAQIPFPKEKIKRLSYKWVRKAHQVLVPPTTVADNKAIMIWQKKKSQTNAKQLKDTATMESSTRKSIKERANKLQVLLFGPSSLVDRD